MDSQYFQAKQIFLSMVGNQMGQDFLDTWKKNLKELIKKQQSISITPKKMCALKSDTISFVRRTMKKEEEEKTACVPNKPYCETEYYWFGGASVY